jgi:hypothetical protein
VPLITLNSANIGELTNGQAKAIIDRELAKAIADLDDRGEEDGKPREVVIKIALIKSRDQVLADVRAKANLPEYRTGVTTLSVKQRGGKSELLFRNDNAENPDQPTLSDMPSRDDA